MFEKVLVPYDFSENSHYAIQCLKKIPNVRQIVLLHIEYNKYPSKVTNVLPPSVDYARLRLEEVKNTLEIPGINIKTITEEITGGEISDVINRIASKEGISLTLMGRRGRGVIETLLIGSVASDILRYGKTDLLLVRSPEDDDTISKKHDLPCPDLFSKVLVCTDFSEPDIVTLCRQELPWIQQVTLIHVVTSGDSKEEVRSAVDTARVRLDPMTDAFTHTRIPAQSHVCVGSAAEEILSFAKKEDISLIVLKSTGTRSLLTTLLGRTTANVARNAQIPVLILRRPSAKGR
ncbi:MAG: universal stress protein [Methanoregula sp.]|nr:universal stress protein [Methanoregula sp.]MDP2796232.1 universal stress protein [Methanoregula sp.]